MGMIMMFRLTVLSLVSTLSFVVAIDTVGSNVLNDTPYIYNVTWFDQKVDHFGFTHPGTFKQRVLINDSFWDSGKKGPMFFYTGNEGNIEAFAQNSGFMWDIAPEFNALLVFAEHRYYGQSLPFGANSTKPDPNVVGYLSSEQALADYASLIDHLKKSIKGAHDIPVISFGGSYGGMLSAWLRIKFPHICDGAIASSAPVAQFSAPCDAFGRIVTADYKQNGDACADTIRTSWDAINNYSSTDAGLKAINSAFKLCKPLAKREDTDLLKSYLSDVWTNLAMLNYPYPTDFLKPLPANPVKECCHRIMANLPAGKTNYTDIMLAVVKGAEVFYNYTGSTKCLDLNSRDDIGAAMWEYQACSEMVMPMCFDGVSDMFEKAPWNLTKVTSDCEALWKVTPQPDMADIMYGSKKLQGASNIIFTNGLMDPWSSGGILKSVSSSVISVLIPEGAHHLDLRSSNPQDPTSVVSARKLERAYIRKWISQAQKRPGWRLRPDLKRMTI